MCDSTFMLVVVGAGDFLCEEGGAGERAGAARFREIGVRGISFLMILSFCFAPGENA